MDQEIASITPHRTWTMVPLLLGAHAIYIKWVYKTKTSIVDFAPKYKARLIARGD